jgi:putative PIN family toxin of toxin-antitoxin system
MKVVFDSNVYIAEALLGEGASELVRVTFTAGWRVGVADYIAGEVERVLLEKFKVRRRAAALTRKRILRRAFVVETALGRHAVLSDEADSAVLATALAYGADYLVSNDHDLRALHPYEGLHIVSMNEYRQLLRERGLIK